MEVYAVLADSETFFGSNPGQGNGQGECCGGSAALTGNSAVVLLKSTAITSGYRGHQRLPIAIGLLVMMYPVLAKVRYDRLDTVTRDRKLLLAALFLVWVVGPALMFTLAWLFLGDLPEYRTGIIIVGSHRASRW